MFILDFFREMKFNNHEGCESPKPSSSYGVDEGHRRSAKSRAEGISRAACRRAAKISGKRTVTGHNSGKRKHRRSNSGN